MSENRTKNGSCSSWLTKATIDCAEPVEPFPNRYSRLIKTPNFLRKFLSDKGSKPKKRFSILSPDEWEPNKETQVFLMADRGSQLLCWTGWTGSQPVHPVDKKSHILLESSYVIKEANKRNGSQFRARMSENRQRKAGVRHGWQRQPAILLNRLNRFPTSSAYW